MLQEFLALPFPQQSRHKMTASPWPGVDAVGNPYASHLRAIARLAKTAEEARQWIVKVSYDKPLSTVYSRVPPEMASRWLEACQDAYATSHAWGPACAIERSGRLADIYIVNGLLQALNETIEHAAEYLGTVSDDRRDNGSRAAQMAARAVSQARFLNER
jgi:hypothetical protein